MVLDPNAYRTTGVTNTAPVMHASVPGQVSTGVTGYAPTPDPVAPPTAVEQEQQRAEGILEPAFDAGAQRRQLINQFYQDPMRMEEINAAIDAERAVQQNQLQQAFSNRQREEAFSRARSGNVGGTVEASQRTGLSADAYRAGAALEEGTRVARQQAEQQLEASRIQEVLNTYQLDPYTTAALQEQLAGLGLEGDAASVLAQSQIQEQQIQNYFNDELSRIAGQAVNIVSNAVQLNYTAQAYGRRGLW